MRIEEDRRMNEQEARLILQACRPGDLDHSDPQIAEALGEVERNPELARWFAEEQAFDRAMAAHLQAVPAPFGLKTRILAQGIDRKSTRLNSSHGYISDAVFCS